MRQGPAFRHLVDAKRYVAKTTVAGSYAIRYPDGHWHKWNDDGAIVRVVVGIESNEESLPPVPVAEITWRK